MAGDWWFYHLTRTTLEQAAGPLLEKCLERGWRVLAVSPDPARLSALDAALWTYADGSFLPHGLADARDLDPVRQPVLLSGALHNQNAAEALLLMDGADAPSKSGYARCMVLFDGHDEPVRAQARAQYKRAKDAGLEVKYFQQTDRGGWKAAG